MATVKNINTGETKQVSSPSQADADAGFVPVASGGSSSSSSGIAGSTASGSNISSGLQGNPFSGLAPSMTLSDIRAAQDQAKASVRESAGALFDPRLDRTAEVGATQVSTTQGATGQRQGFNLSTQSAQVLSTAQDKVQQQLDDITTQKAAYISSGDLQAAQIATEQQQALFSQQLQLTQAQTQYALDVAGVGIQEQQLTQQADQFNQTLEQSIAASIGLTPDGQKTLAATLAEADLSGTFFDAEGNEVPTFAAKTAELSRQLQERGLEIDEAKLAEQIRANRTSEGIAASKLKQTSDMITRSQLNKLNAAGLRDDVSLLIADELSIGNRESAIRNLGMQYAETIMSEEQTSSVSALKRGETQAKKVVDSYINEVNAMTFAEQVAQFMGGGADVGDNTFGELE